MDQNPRPCQVQWPWFIISALWKLRQQEQEFEGNLDGIVSGCPEIQARPWCKKGKVNKTKAN